MPIYRMFFKPHWPRANYIAQVNNTESVFLDFVYWPIDNPKKGTVAIWKIRYGVPKSRLKIF